MKKKFIKNLISVSLMSAMVVGMLTGCGNSGNGDKTIESTESTEKIESKTESSVEVLEETIATKYPRNEKGYPDLGGETFTIWFAMTQTNARATDDLGEYLAIKELEKLFNCNLEFVHPPVGQEKDNFSIMMADELPDMIFCGGVNKYYPGGVDTAYADGVLFDYTEYINEENTPNFWRILQEDEFVAANVKDSEGRITKFGWKINGSEECDITYYGPYIRKNYLEETGMDVPGTYDEWTNMLKAMKENGVKYPIAMTLDNIMNEVFSLGFGIKSDLYLNDDGVVCYGPAEDAYKDYLALWHEWYDEGYLYPDFTTITEADIMSLVAAGDVGATSNHVTQYRYYIMPLIREGDTSQEMVEAPYPALETGAEILGGRSTNRKLNDGKFITADAKNPEACIAFLDALYLDDISYMLYTGVEGIGYEVVDGKKVENVISNDTTEEELLGFSPSQMHAYEGYDLNVMLTQKLSESFMPEAIKLWKQVGTNNNMPSNVSYTTEEAEVNSKYKTDIVTYVKEMTAKFIIGEESLDNFDAYQEGLKKMHIEEWLEVQQAAVDRIVK